MGSTIGERTVVALDTETTGFGHSDRIVSFGAIKIEEKAFFSDKNLNSNQTDVDMIYRLFNPGRRSNSQAEKVHGLSDWVLRHYDSIDNHLEEIGAFLSSADLVVMHNEDFDRRMIEAEFSRAGLRLVWPETKCTMATERLRGRPSSLAMAIRSLGMDRTGEYHGALEDAYFCLSLHLAQSGSRRLPPASAFHIPPEDYLVVPPKPTRAPNRNGYEPVVDLWRRIWPLAVVLRSMVRACGDTDACEDLYASALAQRMGGCLPGEPLDMVIRLTAGWHPSDSEIRQAGEQLIERSDREIFAEAATAMIHSDGVVSKPEVEALRLICLAARREVASE